MPTTYNGVGTHYYGKRNLETRVASCHSCGRQTTLTSYDTRLWFVIVFIPVIPLGRKRILDECPVCRRHYALEADKWETQKQLGISGAMDTYEATPTPEAAMELHQTMLNFHQGAQAAEFRRGMLEKFGDNARVRAYLGEALTRAGNAAEGAPHFARALELRPDLPEARTGVALQHMREGRLDEARGLLDFLEKPGAEQLYSLEPLEILGDSYRNSGKHAPALELYGRLIAALPAIGQIVSFRKKVQISEKAMRPTESILPKRKWSWKSAFGSGSVKGLRTVGAVGIIALLIGAGFVIANEYIRRHRTIYLVNATPADTSIVVKGGGTVRDVHLAAVRQGKAGAVPGTGSIEVAEGRYHVTVGGAALQEFDLDVRTDYWERWGGDPVWVINVRGAALLVAESVTYRHNPPRPTYVLRFGKSQEFLPEVTHPFKDLPASLQLKSGEQRVLTHLDFTREEPMAWIEKLVIENRPAEAIDLAEWAVQRSPDDDSMLEAFVGLARQHRMAERVETVLKAGLARRPVRIGWHRQYQNTHLSHADEAWLTAEYDRMVQAEPENAALLYLRGRLGPDGHAWFERAHRADPQNPYACFALGYDHLALCDFATARPLLATAAQGLPGYEKFAALFWQCRVALGETAALETEARAEIAREPLRIRATERLIEGLAAQGRDADALKVVGEFARAAAKVPPSESAQFLALVRRYAFYATGDFAALEKDSLPDRSPAGRRALFQALIEEGRVTAAVKMQPLDSAKPEDAMHCLVVSVALRQAGDATAADAWLERGAQFMDESSRSETAFAGLVRSAAPPDVAAVAAIKTDSMAKAILLATLAAKHPAQRAELNAIARRLSYPRVYPYHLLQRLSAAK